MKPVVAVAVLATLAVVVVALIVPLNLVLPVVLWLFAAELWLLTAVYGFSVRWERTWFGRSFFATNTAFALVVTWIAAEQQGFITWRHYERVVVVLVVLAMVAHVSLHYAMIRIQKGRKP